MGTPQSTGFFSLCFSFATTPFLAGRMTPYAAMLDGGRSNPSLIFDHRLGSGDVCPVIHHFFHGHGLRNRFTTFSGTVSQYRRRGTKKRLGLFSEVVWAAL